MFEIWLPGSSLVTQNPKSVGFSAKSPKANPKPELRECAIPKPELGNQVKPLVPPGIAQRAEQIHGEQTGTLNPEFRI
jgi:hypothetical protein